MPLFPSFSVTGNSCPARSRRPCQHPPLEYFRAKSENDQLPLNPSFHRPYMGILGCSKLSPCFLLLQATKRCKYTAPGEALPENAQPHPYPSAATLAGTQQPSQAHNHTCLQHLLRSRCSQHPLPLRIFTRHNHPALKSKSCTSTSPPEGSHTGGYNLSPTHLLLHTQDLHQMFPAVGTWITAHELPSQ